MGERASLTQARYRVLLRSLPADDATLDTLRELLRSAGLGDDEIARGERSKHKGVRVRGLAPSDAEILLAAPESRTERAAKGRLDGS